MADKNFLDEDGVSQFAEETKKYIDKHAANADIHVTPADKSNWNGKQNALTSQQIDNINDVVNKANASDLSAVATSGSYNDLSDKPNIPTVNNATLTIKKNGTTVKTFTANASANVTANIVVPTKTSELTNDSGFLTTHNPVDNALSSTSTNAVQNKVINTALNAKANDADVVHKTGAEIVAGIKTFSDGIVSNLINSKTPELVEEQGDGYIRYSSGLQICWGNVNITWVSQEQTAHISFAKNFKIIESILLSHVRAGYAASSHSHIRTWDGSHFIAEYSATDPGQYSIDGQLLWQAIGKWK